MTVSPKTLIKEGVRVFLFLDFDGVINHFPQALTGKSLTDIDRYHEVEKGEGLVHYGFGGELTKTFPLTWAPELIKELNGILADPRVQLLWLTSWERDIAAVQKDLLKLQSARKAQILPLQRKMSDYNNTQAKISAWEDFSLSLPEGVASYIWIDDDVLLNRESLLSWDPGPFSDLDFNPYREAHDRYKASLPIIPHTYVGLQPSHVALMKDFLERALAKEDDENG